MILSSRPPRRNDGEFVVITLKRKTPERMIRPGVSILLRV
jgi:hypothetical protein